MARQAEQTMEHLRQHLHPSLRMGLCPACRHAPVGCPFGTYAYDIQFHKHITTQHRPAEQSVTCRSDNITAFPHQHLRCRLPTILHCRCFHNDSLWTNQRCDEDRTTKIQQAVSMVHRYDKRVVGCAIRHSTCRSLLLRQVLLLFSSLQLHRRSPCHDTFI